MGSPDEGVFFLCCPLPESCDSFTLKSVFMRDWMALKLTHALLLLCDWWAF